VSLEFTKMNGAGNDFLLIDNRSGRISLSGDQIQGICDRRRGVGADGLILIEPAWHFDFHMSFFNGDGGPAEMCGNGARCAAAFAVSLGMGSVDEELTSIHFGTESGGITATVRGQYVSMAMMDAREMRLNVEVQVAQAPENIHFMIVGTRHVIVSVEDAANLTHNYIMELGRALRHDPAFGPIGANVNFVSVDESDRIHIRTYEKGVEEETHACGTGSVAAAVVMAHEGRGGSPRTVVQHGGEELGVSFTPAADGAADVVLSGPVAVNFNGTLSL